MHISSLRYLFVMLVGSLLTGCFEKDPVGGTSEAVNSSASFAQSVSALSSVGACNNGKAGALVYDRTQSSFFSCENGSWQAVDIKGDKGDSGSNGSAGMSGYSSLIKNVNESSGSNCTYGGKKIEVGLDNGEGNGTANNGILETGEVDQASYICNAEGGSVPRLVVKSAAGVTLAFLISPINGNEAFFALPSGHIFRMSLSTGVLSSEIIRHPYVNCWGDKYFGDGVHDTSYGPEIGDFLTLKRVVKDGLGNLYEVNAISTTSLAVESTRNMAGVCSIGTTTLKPHLHGKLVAFSGSLPDFTAVAPIQLVLQ